MKIIVDAMGGDNAPEAIVKGSVYARDRLGVELVLVGRKEEIEKYLGEDRSNIEIVDARDVITMEDDPSTATRRKKDASMTVALTMLKNGEALCSPELRLSSNASRVFAALPWHRCCPAAKTA